MQQEYRVVSVFDHFEWARAELASAQAAVSYYRNKGNDPPPWVVERLETARAEYEEQQKNLNEDLRNDVGQVLLFGNSKSQI